MSLFKTFILAGLSLTLLSGCDWQPRQDKSNRYLSGEGGEGDDSSEFASTDPEPASERACSLSERALDQMVSLSQGGIEYRGNGQLAIDEAAWKQIPSGYRMSLANVVAHVTACPDGVPEEQVVTFLAKGSDAVLAQGKYTEFASE